MSASHQAYSKFLSSSRRAVPAAALMLTALFSADAPAQVQGSCVVNRATFRTQANAASTNSAAFSNIPAMAQNVTVGGANPTCVIVVFTGQVQATANENMLVRVVIPGIGVGEPGEFSLGPGTGTAEARPAQFVFENVPPGTYSVRPQYRSVLAGTTVTLSRATVMVHHR